MSRTVADLHVHTTESDGRTDPDDIPELARQNDLDVIAITDHDTHHDLDSPVVKMDDVSIISGIELRVEAESIDERIDLLGYGVLPDSDIDELVESVRENRKNRAEEMIRRIEEKMDTEIDFEPTVSTGRPHIARAVAENDDIPYNYQGAFDNLIGRDHYCYVSRDIPSFDKGSTVLKNSTLCTSLAHPYRYENTEGALELAETLDAVECNYLYKDDVETGDAPIRKTEEHNLAVTGGSDAHVPNRIGECGLDEEELNRFLNDSGIVELI